jgi:HAE1 family hydrophobic/amphiphilic exporter-1
MDMLGFAEPRLLPRHHAVDGILVDDAIAEIENIVRHMRMGKTPYRAAGSRMNGLAVIAISLTIIAIRTG